MKLASLFITILLSIRTTAQQGYVQDDSTGDFPISTILNYTKPSSSFQQFKDKLLILDFFGTWCVPCIRALPKLSSLQRKYMDRVNILLVSEESKIRLEKFIKDQTEFVFPLVVDDENNFVSRFQPPSYPYTVIIAKNGKIISIPAPEEINENNIEQWLNLQDNLADTSIHTSTLPAKPSLASVDKIKTGLDISQNKLVTLAQEFVYAAKTGDETSGFIARLKAVEFGDMLSMIITDDEKKAFWINLYNGLTQVSLLKNRDQYQRRGKFFGSRQYNIGGQLFSLDDIEHGILRRSRIKWGLGHLTKLFPRKLEKELRVKIVDYRLHFALNCGAKSCPPIAFYSPENINRQLDIATNSYLKNEVDYDSLSNTVKLPAIMGWFRGDFGGKKKMIDLLRRLSILPAGKQPKIKFKNYDWTLYLQNYKS